MSGLEVSYSKEIAGELNRYAICLPGTPVAVGDILTFPFGRGGLFGSQPRPWGSFEKVSDLASLGVAPRISQPDQEPDPYIYASRREVGVSFAGGASGDSASGTLSVAFHREGSVYLAAVDCTVIRLEDLQQVQVDLQAHARDIVWHDTYLVISVTTAAKALVMQSTSSRASFEAGGDVKGLIPGSGRGQISAQAKIDIKSMRDASFIMPWSDNVTMFFGLMRFEKKRFGHTAGAHAFRLKHTEGDEYELVSTQAGDLVA